MRFTRFGTLLATLGVALSTAGQATGPSAVAPAAHWFKLGKLQLASLHDASFNVTNDASVLGVDVGREAVAKVLKADGLPTDTITLSVNALLVRMPQHIVLLDTGLGPNAQGGVLQSLAKARISAEQVTDILITHTHGDHIGGLLTQDGHLAFPNATIRMDTKEWAWLQLNGDAATKALVSTIMPKVQTFEAGATVVPGIKAVGIDGHTPGHTGFEISSGGAHLFDIGDTAHSASLSLQHPEWTFGYDSDKVVGRVSREQTLARLAKSHELVFSPHFPFPGIGMIVAKGNAFAWRPAKTAAR